MEINKLEYQTNANFSQLDQSQIRPTTKFFPFNLPKETSAVPKFWTVP